MAEEIVNSDFEEDRIINAILAKKELLSKQILKNRQEHQAKLKDASKPVIKKANYDIWRSSQRPGNDAMTPHPVRKDFSSCCSGGMNSEYKRKNSSFSPIDFNKKKDNLERFQIHSSDYIGKQSK